MNYIILDLEWNQAFETESNPSVPFEIVEIGAVKLDEQMEIVDQFQSYIKPLLYPMLHYKVKQMLGYSESTLRQGRPFHMVCREFLKWCGADYRFVTWGELDLEQLQRNMDYYGLRKLDKPLPYYNLQRIYSKLYQTEKAVRLEQAVEQQGIDKDRPFHQAVNDAYYTGKILQGIEPTQFIDEYSFDTYNNPKNKQEEIRKQYRDSYQYITREFSNKNEANADKEIMSIHCPLCQARAGKKIRWFANSHTIHYCGGKCKTHGTFVGKLKYKTAQSGKLYIIKTLKLTEESALHTMKARQEELRAKRRERARRNKKLLKNGSK